MPPLKTLNLIENKTGRKNVVVSRHRFHLKSGAFIFIKYLKMAEKGATPKTYCRRDVVFNVYVDINNEILRKMNKVYGEGGGDLARRKGECRMIFQMMSGLRCKKIRLLEFRIGSNLVFDSKI